MKTLRALIRENECFRVGSKIFFTGEDDLWEKWYEIGRWNDRQHGNSDQLNPRWVTAHREIILLASEILNELD